MVGVAPGAPLISIKVLDCAGVGMTSTVIKGVDWITANARRPGVVNMSLGGPPSTATDQAVMTVAATDTANQEPAWSNYGPCVDIWAPGVAILSTRPGGGTATMSGTSMASPHVAGTAALYLRMNPGARPADVELALKLFARPTATFSKDGRPIQLDYAGAF